MNNWGKFLLKNYLLSSSILIILQWCLIMVTRTDFNRYMMPTYKPANFIPSKAKGSIVWDKKNKKYIDFASGIAVSSLGHCHHSK